MWWRSKVLQWTLLSVSITASITTIIVGLMLLPSIINGPDSINYIDRAECEVNQFEIIENLCLRDISQDFSNLVYREDWIKCVVIKFNISNSLSNQTCHWFYPEQFETNESATIAIRGDIDIIRSDKYKCVYDTLNNICYPDKSELLVFCLVVGGLLLLSICFLLIYMKVKKIEKKRIKSNNNN